MSRYKTVAERMCTDLGITYRPYAEYAPVDINDEHKFLLITRDELALLFTGTDWT